MSLNKKRLDPVIAELREQGLEVTASHAIDEAWYIEDDSFNSFIASGNELLALKSSDRLNIHGIKSLG